MSCTLAARPSTVVISPHCLVDGACQGCGSLDRVEDFERGDTICTGCGLVQSERNRESGPNIRLFADDSDKKNQDKIHWAPLSRYDELAYKSTRVTVTEVVGNAGAMTQTRFKKMVAEPRDDTDFLEDGFGCIKEAFRVLFYGRGCNEHLAQAQDIFYMGWRAMVAERTADSKLPSASKTKDASWRRQKLARKHQLAVAALWYVLRKNNVGDCPVDRIASLMDGKLRVSPQMVVSALKYANIHVMKSAMKTKK